jgi:hypothetical protein
VRIFGLWEINEMRIKYAVNFVDGAQETLDADRPFHGGETLPKRFEGDRTWQVTRVFHQYALNAPPRPENVVAGTLDVVSI